MDEAVSRAAALSVAIMIPASWLRLVPGCEQGETPQRIVSLGSGTAHQLWRVRSRRGDYVLRAPDAAAPRMLTPVFQRECLLQRCAAGLGLAPQIMAVSSSDSVLVMQFIDGRQPTPHELGCEPWLAQLLAAVQRLHGAPVPDLPPLNPLADAAMFAQQVLAAQPTEAPLIRRRLQWAEALWREIAADGRARAVIHCDLHAGNIIVRGDAAGQLIFLDWEYANVGDPLLDFAALCAQYPLVQPQVMQFLVGQAPRPAISAQRLFAATAVFRLLSWLWWRARSCQQANVPGSTPEQLQQMVALEEQLDQSLERAQC